MKISDVAKVIPKFHLSDPIGMETSMWRQLLGTLPDDIKMGKYFDLPNFKALPRPATIVFRIQGLHGLLQHLIEIMLKTQK